MKVVYRDKKGRFTRQKKSSTQYTYDDNWKQLDVSRSFFTKREVKKISQGEELPFREQVVRNIRRASIRQPKEERFIESYTFTRKDNSDLFSFLSHQKLNDKLARVARSKQAKGKVLIGEVITTIGDRKQEVIVSRQFKLTHLGDRLKFQSGKRKGRAYSMSDHVAHFIHDSVNHYQNEEAQQFTLYATETYGRREKQRRKRGRKQRLSRSQQTFELRLRVIPKNKAWQIFQTSELVRKPSDRSVAKTKRTGRKRTH